MDLRKELEEIVKYHEDIDEWICNSEHGELVDKLRALLNRTENKNSLVTRLKTQ
jgi:hypothetical protein